MLPTLTLSSIAAAAAAAAVLKKLGWLRLPLVVATRSIVGGLESQPHCVFAEKGEVAVMKIVSIPPWPERKVGDQR